jgi:hypothetical protein
MRSILLLPLVLACNGGLSKVGSTEGDADTDADGDSDADADGDTEPDPAQDAATQFDLQPNPGCEQFVDTDGTAYDIPGATTYFAGKYTITDDGDVSAYEWMILFANDAWTEAAGAQDCQITWVVTGSVTDVGEGCPTCDFGIVAVGRVDMQATNCIEGFTEDIRSDFDPVDLVYDVNTLGSHSATFFYPSGREMANGPVDGENYSWVTDSACKWF